VLHTDSAVAALAAADAVAAADAAAAAAEPHRWACKSNQHGVYGYISDCIMLQLS
jgi:hypothetical protein